MDGIQADDYRHLSAERIPLLQPRQRPRATRRDDLSRAIDDYTKAIAIDANLAEAYYNRGLVYLRKKETEKAVADLSKAGERGLYKAYGIIKKYGQK